MVPRALRILQAYWIQITMVAKSRVYYIPPPPLKVYHCVTQVDPLSPTIFDVVLESIIRHWLMLVASTEASTEVIYASLQDFAVYFYTNYKIVVSTQTERFQRSFDVIADLFN